MERLIRLIIKLFTVLLLFLTACVNEPCLDLAELDKQLKQVQQWQVEDNISSKTIVDSYEMSQTLIIGNESSNFYDKSVEDRCGNIFGSWSYYIGYSTSLSLINFTVHISATATKDDGFLLKLTSTKTNPFLSKATTYDFVSQKSKENNAMIERLEKVLVLDNEYADVLKITFKITLSNTDVKTVYYAKGIGIIRFELANGNIFNVI